MKSFTVRPSWARAGPNTKPNRPSHHANDQGTAFRNPWPSADAPTWAELLDGKFPLGWYDNLAKNHPGTRDVKVVTPDWGASNLKEQGLARRNCIIGTTLGHAGTIAEIPLEGTEGKDGEKKSLWVLVDPIFSLRAGPTQYMGPQRMKPPPCQVSDLPGCDVVMISHNHYDHLDLVTIQAVVKKFPKARYFVPLGNKGWISSLGVSGDKIFELDWWQNREYSVQDLGHTTAPNGSEDTMIRFTCVPAQHNSGRGALDQGTTLWCGWVIEQLLVSKDEADTSKLRRKGAIYHAGDTGYRRTAKSSAVCPVFKEIGLRFGGFDLAFIPIWRGGTLGFISNFGLRLSHNDIPSALHTAPIDAIDIHNDVFSKNTLAVHFGTFVGSENESLEAIMEFQEGRENRGVLPLDGQANNERGRAGIVDIGGSFAVEISVQDIVGKS
ncbi:N-acyl-phosphatidylethanolamine-hydrolyzing phospholipase D [Hyphodiscus hymeniophilus]|uniref:N-acyl-phosphatidylethanolamine-hydrolyzing phospholipase D n=1 Tax=Hyphodiscus hymeniophilus TaxID=353542 RepID=A0A9P6SL49_9HELO|nr:N-acyl-phosphatidylethanolamine-hydrolyzing phospholipase D [Hyphodiscus hymeniophilus]